MITFQEGQGDLMNIFFLDRDIQNNARSYCDQHVVKMSIEFGQLLSNVWWAQPLDLWPKDPMFRALLNRESHPRHRCSRWVQSSVQHYRYLIGLGLALSLEHRLRFGTPSGAHPLLKTLEDLGSPDLPDLWEDPPRTFGIWSPEIDPELEIVSAHRRFYVLAKSPFARWRHSDPPGWWPEKI